LATSADALSRSHFEYEAKEKPFMKTKSRAVDRFIVLILVLFVGLLSAQAQDAPLRGFDDYFNKAIKDWGVPGVAIAVVKDDRIVFAKGYGVRELGKPSPVDERTMFAIGSSSKAFTATAIAMLVDEEKLKWDDPATKYLCGFQLYDPYVTRELTVRDLLSHRVGLERGDFLWYASPYDRNEILRRIRYLKPSSSMRPRAHLRPARYDGDQHEHQGPCQFERRCRAARAD
jgi:CubicO group peptidase (beta-lactamase class C family)